MAGIIILWLLWCLLHSALITRTVSSRIERLPAPWPGAYKLAYTTFSLLTLLPLAWVSHSYPQKPIALPLWAIFLQVLLLAYALFLFTAGARQYSLADFSGWSQWQHYRRGEVAASPKLLRTGGILRHIRHPWYAAALALLWVFPLTDLNLIIRFILSIYIVVGTWLEERKLAITHGERYRAYSRVTPRFFPWKLFKRNCNRLLRIRAEQPSPVTYFPVPSKDAVKEAGKRRRRRTFGCSGEDFPKPGTEERFNMETETPTRSMDTSQAPLFFVLNVAAGSQHAEATIAAIKKGMAGSERDFRLITLKTGNAKKRIRAVVDEACTAGAIVVAAGGDGTICGVAQQLVNRPCPLGVLPQGTFNYFARSLGMQEETEAAVQQLLHSHPKPIQAGMVNGQLFLVNASLGLHPQMLLDREAFKAKLGRHRLVAMLAGLFTLAQRPHDLNLCLSGDSGELSINSPLLFVCNNPLQLEQLGLGHRQSSGPAPALRGSLMAVLLRHAGSMQLYRLALKGALGTLGEDELLSLSTFKHLTVQPRPRWQFRFVKVALDGEVKRMRTPLYFEAVAGAISVMMPPLAPSVSSTHPATPALP